LGEAKVDLDSLIVTYLCYVGINFWTYQLPLHLFKTRHRKHAWSANRQKMLCIYRVCPHSLNTKKIISNLNSLNTFTTKKRVHLMWNRF
jgi:hypothetical protein